MDKFYVTRFLLALRLEQCSLERLSFPKYLQTFCPVSAQNWNICPLLLYIISSWITLCVCVLHFGSFHANIFLCFCFMHMLHQCSKCIANCLPFKVSLLYHRNFQTSTRSCTVDYVSHSSPSRICSRFSPWKQLTGRMSEEIFGRGKLEFFK